MNGRGVHLLSFVAVCGFIGWLLVTTRTDSQAGAPPPTPRSPAALGGSTVPCETTIAWRVADVDPRFGVSQREVQAAAEEAAELWRIEARRLFVRDSLLGMPIRLVYDERQSRTDDRVRALQLHRQSEVDLATEERDLRVAWERQTEAQQRSLVEWAAHDSAIGVHNGAVRRWNAAGDAPPDTVEALAARGERLRAHGVTLLEAARRLQAENEELRSRERALAEGRAAIDRGAARLASAFPLLEVESGTYLEAHGLDAAGAPVRLREIRVFRFESRNELVRILAHELGHALGLAHVDEPGALMSPRRDGSGEDPLSLHAADHSALAALCR